MKDSVWIVDFCGSVKFTGYSEPTSFWAVYYPDDHMVEFGGAWSDAPNMPAMTEPTEKEVEEWVKDKCVAEKRWAARRRRDEANEKVFEDLDKYFKKNGYNWIEVDFRLPDGSLKSFNHHCGKLTLQGVRAGVAYYLYNKLPKGSKIAKFKFRTGLTIDGKKHKVKS